MLPKEPIPTVEPKVSPDPVSIVLMIRRSEAFWRHGTIDPGFIIRNPEKAAKVSAAIEWWNTKFWFSYIDFRMALRSLALELHRQAGFVEIVPWQDQGAVARFPENSWLVPIDEDDWIAPGMAHRLRSVCSNCTFNTVTWDVIRKSADGATAINPNTFVESCGYACRLPFDWLPICNHMHIKAPSKRDIAEVLALRNETPASMAFLYKNSIDDVLPALRRAVAATGEGVPPEFLGVWIDYQSLLKRLLASLRKSSSVRATV
jgi:hypothetical protein